MVDFFQESTYVDAQGKPRKCYLVTKLGCDYLATSFTGEKGNLFRIKYIERFNKENNLVFPVEPKSNSYNDNSNNNNISSITSLEVAEMIEKDHSKLLRDIRRYSAQLSEAKIGLVEFFQESTYKDSKGEERPCYLVTKKGCEFISHKLTGTKGAAFTACYINRFHEMEQGVLKRNFP